MSYRPTERQRQKDASPVYERVRTYDGFGRVQRTSLAAVETGAPGGPQSAGTYLMDYAYDLAGRVVEVEYPEATTVRYEYEGAYLLRVCDLGTATDCSDPSVVSYVSDVEYDGLGRRDVTEMDAGIRTFDYDGSLPRLLQDRFEAAADPYWYERNVDGYDELGNVLALSGTTQPGDVDLVESFAYDARNRLDSWTKGGSPRNYGHDDLGNLTSHAGATQMFDDPDRPHALKQRMVDGAVYSYDPDGNVTSILGGASPRHFTFDSANRLLCAGTTAGDCSLHRVRYDVDGRRVLDDPPEALNFTVYVDDAVRVVEDFDLEFQIEIQAFGERIAYKRAPGPARTAGGGAAFGVPPEALPLAMLLGVAGLGVWAARRGAWVLVVVRPARAGVCAGLTVVLVLGPAPALSPPIARAGGGGWDPVFHWELADRLGTGMVMLDANGARIVHRTYAPFGEVDTVAGDPFRMPAHFAGHLADEDSGLVYMQARWYDAKGGTFLSVDPVVPDATDPQSYNAYAYARNNPISFTDPTGMCPASLLGGSCEGKWYGYTNSIQGHQAASTDVVDPGYLADYGWQAGSVAANLGAFDGYPSLGEFFGGLIDFFTPGGSEGHPYPTDLVSIRALADGTTEFTYIPEDVLDGRHVGVFVDRALANSAAVAAYGEFGRVRGGQWLGQNGKWYSLQWGGNQYAGARSAVTHRAALFRAAGRAVAAVQAARGVQDMVTGDTPLARTSGAFDVGLVAVGVWGGPGGLGVSLGMGVMGIGFEDVVGGVGRVSEVIINAGPNGPLR